MGADLYLEPMHSANYKALKPLWNEKIKLRDSFPRESVQAAAVQQEVDALYDLIWGGENYFRDSYNGSSVLKALGLSWWADVVPLQDDAGNLSTRGIATLIEMIEARAVPLLTHADLEEMHVMHDAESTPETWHAYFVEKRARLLQFLRRGMQEGVTLRASL